MEQIKSWFLSLGKRKKTLVVFVGVIVLLVILSKIGII
mgnify:FL=1|jgi:hypothetical protein